MNNLLYHLGNNSTIAKNIVPNYKKISVKIKFLIKRIWASNIYYYSKAVEILFETLIAKIFHYTKNESSDSMLKE